jgi:pilus assembly protein CpaE
VPLLRADPDALAAGRDVIHSLLLAVADDAVAQQLTAVARASAELVIAGRVINPDQLARAVTGPGIDVVLIDATFGPGSVLDLARALTAAAPDIGLVLATSSRRASLIDAAMAAGFRGAVGVPAGREELRAAVVAAGEWAQALRAGPVDGPDGGPPTAPVSRRRRGEMVALAAGKGGAGTTTLMAHLGLAAVRAGRTACVVDLDLGTGDLRGLLGLPDQRSLDDLLGVPLSPERVDGALALHTSGLRALVLPAELDYERAVSPQLVGAVLAHLRTSFDVVLVDIGGGRGDAARIAAGVADCLTLVVTPDVPSLRGAQRLLAHWRRRGVRAQDVRVVCNRAVRDGDVGPEFLAQALPAPMLPTTVPADWRALQLAANTGKPALVPEGPWRAAIDALAADLGLLPHTRRAHAALQAGVPVAQQA